MGSVSILEQGRRSFALADWREASRSLAAADASEALGPADLELLARAAYMLGRDDDYVDGLGRAFHAHMEADSPAAAIRCSFWIGHSWLFRGQAAPAFGWFSRAERLLDREPGDVVERGYVLIGKMLQHLVKGEAASAFDAAVEIADVGQRFGDPDLVAIGLMEQGHALVRQGRAEDGVRLVDESMIAVTSGELSPIVAGIVYCNTIAFCHSVYQLRRVREWTDALTRWCERQPDMVAHKGVCLVHRAEIMTLGGAWSEALEELRRLGEPLGALNLRASGEAAYREGEIHRLRGEFARAEEAYGRASRLDQDPQPGLALMRLAQNKLHSAAPMIRRAVSESSRGLPRVALLPACVEIALATGDADAAAGASRELADIAAQQSNGAIEAMSRQARGAVALAEGDAATALAELRLAVHAWQELEAPYDAARSRVLIGRACRLLGDEDSAVFELRTALEIFTRLGARPDMAALEALLNASEGRDLHGLTHREAEVLRLVATGKTNREIAAVLVLSQHTVARHLQNIFAKIGVSSRTAASAFAHDQDLD